MARVTIVLLILIMLMGCTSQSIKTEAQETYVPILYCPKPPEIKRPVLPIFQMTPDQLNNGGEIVKHYKASIIVLQGYAIELEKALQQYDNVNSSYDELRHELINSIKSTNRKKPNGIN